MSTSGPGTGVPLTVVFCALSIFDEVGGIQRFNQRVIDAALNGSEWYVEKMIVISLTENGSRRLNGNAMLIGCNGSRWRCFAEFIKLLIRARPSLILFGHVNLVAFAALARIIVPKAKQALFVHGIDVW